MPEAKSKPKPKAKPKAGADLKKAVIALLDDEIRYWNGRLKEQKEQGLFFLSTDDRLHGALAGLRRFKGKLLKEVF